MNIDTNSFHTKGYLIVKDVFSKNQINNFRKLALESEKIDLIPFKDSYKYIFIIILLTIFNHFQKLYVTIFRIEKQLMTIIKGEFVVGFSLFLIPFFLMRLIL